MRILQIYRDYFIDLPGGIERHVYDLAHGLRHLGTVDVLAASQSLRGRRYSDDGVDVRLAPELFRFKGVAVAPSFIPAVIRGNYDLVHFHSPNPTGEVAARLARHPLRIATYHADTERGARVAPVYRRLLHWSLGGCRRVLVGSDRVVANSPVLAPLRERRPDLIEIVPFGIDTARFAPEPSAGAHRLRAGWGETVVLFVGRLRYYKGLPYLIEAMRALPATLVVVGDGPERADVVRLGKERLGARFVWAGAVSESELPDVYGAADIFCLPSRSSAEAFGFAALEAMASGVPVITTEVGTATSEINVDGESGFVVPPGDPTALRSALEKLLADRELAAEMGAAGRARVLASYDKAAMLERIASIYKEVAEEARS